MKNPQARSVKYLGFFAGMFFLASAQYCWANPIIMQEGIVKSIVPLSIGECLVILLEMILLRWLLSISLSKALETSFMANLVSAAASLVLVDLFEFSFMHFSISLDLELVGRIVESVSYFLIPLIFAILIEGLVIGALNRQAGRKRILKAAVIANCISYPLFVVYMALVMR